VSGQNSEGFAAPQYGWQACVKAKKCGRGKRLNPPFTANL
jgi:hypothetical protein